MSFRRSPVEVNVTDLRLVSDLVILRPYQITDVVQMFTAIKESFAELRPYMPWCHENYAVGETRSWVESTAKNWQEGLAYDFAIIDPRDGAFLGGCSLNHVNTLDRWANLGYWVRSTRARRGIATTAALLAAHFGFGELKFNRLEIVVAVENSASRRVAQNVGARQEGIMRNRLWLQDRAHDAVLFSLIPSDKLEIPPLTNR